MAKTVNYLHTELHVLHRDLAPNTWLLDNANERILLADFKEASQSGEFHIDTALLADTFVEMLGNNLERYGRSLNCLVRWMYKEQPPMSSVVEKLELMNEKFEKQ